MMDNSLDNSEDLWLIRKQSNQIVGPVARSQVLEMVQQGHLEPLDEICPANGYWFHLQEVEEVRRHLGVQDVFVRKSGSGDLEATLNDITKDTITEEITPSGAVEVHLTQSKVAALQARPALTADELAKKFQRPESAVVKGVRVDSSSSPEQIPVKVERSLLIRALIALFALFLLWGLYKIYLITNQPGLEP